MKIFRALILLFTFAFLPSISISAQSNSDFSTVCKNLSEHKITKGNFNQIKMIKKLKREIKSSGIFLISVDKGVLWNTQKPLKSSMAITKDGIIQTNAQGKKNVVATGGNAIFEQVSGLLTSLFDGNFDEINKNFDIEFIGSAESWNVNLVPKDSSVKNFIESIEMVGSDKIDAMILHESGGDFTKYEFSNQIFPDSLTSEELSAFTEK